MLEEKLFGSIHFNAAAQNSVICLAKLICFSLYRALHYVLRDYKNLL
jgi:hypothetical protein